MDTSRRELEKVQQLEEETKELEERKYANDVLQKHGVTQSKALQVKRRGSKALSSSNQSRQDIEEMIQNYQKDIHDQRIRLSVMEEKEVQRLKKE